MWTELKWVDDPATFRSVLVAEGFEADRFLALLET
jgi:hypothetical protein